MKRIINKGVDHMSLINDFVRNPLGVSKEYVLDTQHVMPIANPPTIVQGEVNMFDFQLDISSTNRGVAEIKYSRVVRTPLHAYYLPYGGNNTIALSSIPKIAHGCNFVFTPMLTGCSIIVTDGGTNWNVYHHSKVDAYNPAAGPNFHSEPVLASYQYMNYGLERDEDIKPSPDHPAYGGTAFMWFNDDRWNLIGQQQLYWFDERTRKFEQKTESKKVITIPIIH